MDLYAYCNYLYSLVSEGNKSHCFQNSLKSGIWTMKKSHFSSLGTEIAIIL